VLKDVELPSRIYPPSAICKTEVPQSSPLPPKVFSKPSAKADNGKNNVNNIDNERTATKDVLSLLSALLLKKCINPLLKIF
jgi:hypothetical protein